jgi:hypothetical protein
MDRDEERNQLHEAVDRIVNGPPDLGVDGWVVQVLFDVGNILRAAAPALDYEVGRVISGVDRPHGYFPINGSWKGAGISVSSQQCEDWIIAGHAALDESRPPTIQQRQRALAAVLRSIARSSRFAWLVDLVDGLEGLRFGEVKPLLTKSDIGLDYAGKGMTAWKLRLRALRWVEFQVAARKVKTKAAAYEVVASKFEREPESVKDWPNQTAEYFGEAVVRETLKTSRDIGEYAYAVSQQVASGNKTNHDYLKHLESVYGDKAIEELAMKFKALPRKRKKPKSKNGGT